LLRRNGSGCTVEIEQVYRYLPPMSEPAPLLTVQPLPKQRKPDWIRVKAPTSTGFR
jgi:hypothetical protein